MFLDIALEGSWRIHGKQRKSQNANANFSIMRATIMQPQIKAIDNDI